MLCSFSDRQIFNVKSIQLGKLYLNITLVNAMRWKINLIYTENFIYSANCFRLSYRVIYFSLRCNGIICCCCCFFSLDLISCSECFNKCITYNSIWCQMMANARPSTANLTTLWNVVHIVIMHGTRCDYVIIILKSKHLTKPIPIKPCANAYACHALLKYLFYAISEILSTIYNDQ